MLAISTVLTALFLSLLFTRVATIALSITGLSKESARFQAALLLRGSASQPRKRRRSSIIRFGAGSS